MLPARRPRRLRALAVSCPASRPCPRLRAPWLRHRSPVRCPIRVLGWRSFRRPIRHPVRRLPRRPVCQICPLRSPIRGPV
eukprot:739412-Pleurochrysis_carterae.AAC.1